jgi:chemotaxis-related protein WspB
MATAAPMPGQERRISVAPRERRLFLRFTLGTDLYVMDAQDIDQVLALKRLKQIPNAAHWVAGIMQYRGEPVPVIDMAALATGASARLLTSTRIVLVHYRHAPQAAARALGLILENATETVHYDMADFVPCGLDNRDAPYLGPVRAGTGGLEQWVRVHDLLPASVRVQLFPETAIGERP